MHTEVVTFINVSMAEHCSAVQVKSGNEMTGCWFFVCSLILCFELISAVLGWLWNTEHTLFNHKVCSQGLERKWLTAEYTKLHSLLCGITVVQYRISMVWVSLHRFRNQKPKEQQIMLGHTVTYPYSFFLENSIPSERSDRRAPPCPAAALG